MTSNSVIFGSASRLLAHMFVASAVLVGTAAGAQAPRRDTASDPYCWLEDVNGA